jgi:hypothetical protein
MAASKGRYSKEEFARRGDALVESKVCPKPCNVESQGSS